ncbi:hypothetical protein BLX87_09250 [Bacillus sp. VT-16-64]|nr:hypothetical protein BLX87_09250 [Bacillus sp. VT-16-64]
MDVLTFGETMVAFTALNNRSIVQHHDSFVSVAGAETNVSIALARLGHRVKWFSRLGDDPFGRKILYELNAHQIDTSGVMIDPHYPTGIMFKQKKELLDTEVIYYRDHSAATQLSKKDLQNKWVKDAKVLHITGITPSLSASCKELVMEAIALAKQHQTVISFDPNIRLKLWSIEEAKKVLIPIAKQCDIFLPGKSEMKLLCGAKHLRDIQAQLAEWAIPLTVMKDGANGAWIIQKGCHTFVPPFPVRRVVDEIGAGDAFAAGFLHGYLRGESHETSVKFGHACAAFVVSSEGDTSGLPMKHELERFLNKDSETLR